MEINRKLFWSQFKFYSGPVGCGKVGSLFPPLCKNCQEQCSSKVESNTRDDDTYDFNEDTADTCFFLSKVDINSSWRGRRELTQRQPVEVEFEEYQS